MKALIGGVTSIQGSMHSSDNACIKGLVRNLDFSSGLYGTEMNKERLYHQLDIGRLDNPQDIIRKLDSKEITSFFIHLSEGKDKSSRDEFRNLKEKGLLRKETGIIHGVALEEEDFVEMENKDVKLIWSPRSNEVLYEKTANIPLAFKHHITVALAPDWSITGSDNMISELEYASGINAKEFGSILQESDFLRMITANPAEMAGVDDKIGSVKPKRFADIIVVKGNKPLLETKIQDISLVIIDGQPVYGDTTVMDQLGKTGDYETIGVCGVQKGIDITSDDETIPGGKQSLSFVLTRLHSYYPKLAPLFECN